MCKVLVFAGTTEGRRIAEFLHEHKVPAHICVATSYGESLLPSSPYVTVSHERLDVVQMETLMREIQAEPVIDATHPYAAAVTENIKEACILSGCRYVRLLRENREAKTEGVYVESVDAAAEFLKGTKGNILTTTGSKEVGKYTVIPGYKDRVYARVLSLANVAAQCAAYGFEGKNLICMQGPFSKELNKAMIRQLNIRYLVTKMSGNAGGFEEKMQAAKETGCIPVIVGRPLKEEGISLKECKKMLCEKFGIVMKQKIALVGIGMGSPSSQTLEAREAIDEAELVIGAGRMLDAAGLKGQDSYKEYDSDKICSYIERHPEYEKIAVVLSGDVGFYSGAKKLSQKLRGEVRMVCGISSVVYFMGKIQKPWDDICITSAHGRSANLISLIRKHGKVFSILGTRDGVSRLAKELLDYHMDDVKIYVGEQLSYEKEKIMTGLPKDFADYTGDALSVVYLEKEDFKREFTTHGIRDAAFLRDKVPMTKEEVRTVSLSKLQLLEDSVCYDVGAGTGSVSIEMALRCPAGKVYAIEKKPLAVELLKKNKAEFAADNLEIVEGEAPEALESLEIPTHAFIGGSSGNMKQILALLLAKNPNMRIVINCIALESVGEALNCLKELPVTDTEVIQLSVSRAKTVGPYHMMMGENPITILSCTGKAE